MRFLTGFFSSAVAPDQQAVCFTLPDSPFNYESDAHRGLITQQVARFNKALTDLQKVDDHILIGTGIAVGSWLTCGFLPLVTVGMMVSAYVGYCGATRAEYDRKYREAQQDLINVYQWSMGKESGHLWYKLGVKEIQALITTLGPWVNKDTIYTWRPDDLRPSGLSVLTTSRRSDIPVEVEHQFTTLAAGVHMNTVKFRLYGEGSVNQWLSRAKDAVVSRITDFTMGYKQL